MTRVSRCWAATTCVIAATVASCFIKPDPPGVTGDGSPGSDGSGPPPGDGRSSDGAPQFGCASHSVSIHFPGMILSDCGPWATPTGGPIGTTGGPLMVMTQLQNMGACASLTTGTGGAISVVAAPGTPGDSVFLQAMTGAQLTTMRLVIAASARQLEISGANGVVARAYDPQSMLWWRLSASGPNTLVGEFSADGLTWSLLGTESIGPATAASVRMSFGVSSTAQGSGSFDDYVECQ